VRLVSDGGEQRVDEVRLLAARSEVGYVSELHRALHDEPEAVDAATQERYSELARRRDSQRLRAEWGPHRDLILREVDLFLNRSTLPSRLRRSVALVARAARGVDRAFD
jgi:hypothetical protein